jgi:hypothetical protein
MSNSIHLKRGQHLKLPVTADHPLAQYQTVRTLKREELLKHPIYSKVVESRVRSLQNRVIETQGFAAKLSPEAVTAVMHEIIWRIGPIAAYQLGDIMVDSQAVLTYHGNYHIVFARNVTIADGGSIKVYCDDPTISATLSLECNQLAGV